MLKRLIFQTTDIYPMDDDDDDNDFSDSDDFPLKVS